ncbi:MAG TPA: hypothetical protein VEB68_05745 [Croceibacterium sp.]|nr:hypothetical protein [Croceibacterium sp.]
MMAMSEDRRGEDRPAGVKKVALAVLFGMILLFAIGAVIGAGVAVLEPGSDTDVPVVALLVAVAIAAALLSLWGLMKLKPWAGPEEPMSPNTRKANNLLMLAGVLGAVLGAVLSLGAVSLDDPFALFSNGPMPPAVVIPAIAVWLLIVPVISWHWHRSIDEHEVEAYKFGGIAALYLYAFVTPAWWLAWRAGLVPAPETMVIYLAVIGLFGAGWFWRRSR